MSSIAIIGIAGLVAGTLDLTASATLFVWKGGSLEKILQFIASGALGVRSFEGGKKTAAVGIAFHFFIALCVAAVYYFLRLRIPLIVADPVMTGILYGLLGNMLFVADTFGSCRTPAGRVHAPPRRASRGSTALGMWG